jgi:hypothetical protein
LTLFGPFLKGRKSAKPHGYGSGGRSAMRRKKAKPNYRRIMLRLPDLDHSKLAVLK